MQEPLPTADSVTEILPGIFRWAAHSPRHKVELTAHAVHADGWLLVFDPIPLAKAGRRRLLELPARAALILTNANHERDTARWREALAANVWAQPGVIVPATPQRPFSWANPLPFPGWSARPLPGGASGETCFLHDGLSLAVFGDAVVNLPGRELELLPAKYCEDPARLRTSLAALPRFERALFAHGLPLLSAARDRMAALL